MPRVFIETAYKIFMLALIALVSIVSAATVDRIMYYLDSILYHMKNRP